MSGSQVGPVIAYKLFSLKKSGEIGPLFISRRMRLEEGVWYKSACIPTKGFAVREGFHCCFSTDDAPHLAQGSDRVWKKVLIDDFTTYDRPASQGSKWALAGKMMVLGDVLQG